MCVILCIHHLYISGQVEFSLQGRHSFCSMMCCASSAATIPRERLDDERYPTALPPSSCQQLPGGCRRDAIDCSCCELSWKRHRERDDQTTKTDQTKHTQSPNRPDRSNRPDGPDRPNRPDIPNRPKYTYFLIFKTFHAIKDYLRVVLSFITLRISKDHTCIVSCL